MSDKRDRISVILTDYLLDRLEDEMRSIDTYEVGLVIDMIKDLAEANEKAAEAIYYEEVVEAMEKGETKSKSQYERSFESYDEIRRSNPGMTDTAIASRVKGLNSYLDAIWEDIQEMLHTMSPQEKGLTKTHLQEMITNIA